MSTFSTEIWTPGLSSQTSHGRHSAKDTSTHDAKDDCHLPPKRNLLYRIFHIHDHHEESPSQDSADHPTSSSHPSPFSIWARSRRSYHSGTESDSEVEDPPSSDTSVRRKSMKKWGMSDSESESEEPSSLFPKRRSSNIFKDLLHARPRRASASSGSGSHTGESSSDSEQEDSSKHTESYNNLFKGLILGHKSKKSSPSSSPTSSPCASTMAEAAEPLALSRSASEVSLTEKYGKKETIIGKGGHAIVRLCCPVNSEKKYAVKEFRKRRKDETQKEYVKKLIAEFCISSSLENVNVVKTVDLIQDEKHQWCVVMEFCSGGDLFNRIHDGDLTDVSEINCYFKQLVSGVEYLHRMGVAHKDLKPENLLLDSTRSVLKISDFGVSEVFRAPFCSHSRKGHGRCGSGPYIAPEEYTMEDYDSAPVDIWAMGIIYYVMSFNTHPWKSAQVVDSRYKYYAEHYKHYWPLDRLSPALRSLVYQLLDPQPQSRITIQDIMKNEWYQHVDCCVNEQGLQSGAHHSHKLKSSKKQHS